MSAAHTPGPWRSSGTHVWSEAAKDRGNVAECEDFECSTDAERAANARLIAAAPEMLEALRVIAAWEPSRRPDEEGGMSIMEAIDTARAAIARAEGCAVCAAHYGDGGVCDEGKPVASRHRSTEGGAA